MTNTLPPIDFNKILNEAGTTSQPRKRKRRPRKKSFGESFGGLTQLLATMTTATLLVKSGPLILIGLAGALLCFRSCISLSLPMAPQSQPIASQPQQGRQVMQQQSTTLPSPYGNPSESVRARPARATIASPGQSARPMETESDVDSSHLLIVEDEPIRQVPAMFFESHALPFAPQPMGLFPSFDGSSGVMGSSPPQGLFGGPNMTPMGNAIDPSSRFMENTIANPSATSAEPSSQFSFKRGRKFTGTSQQSGNPSMRVQLAITGVKDRGTNITARLTSLEKSGVGKNYTGLIETNPLRLTLIPEAQSNGFGTFVTYSPWHSNSPTRITLAINSDKGLSGTSVSGEQFDLQAEPEPIPKAIPSPSFHGFDSDALNQTVWTILHKNGEAVSGESWIFDATSKSFEWRKESKVIAKGNYKESIALKSLDIILVKPTSTKVYSCLFHDTPGKDNSVRVCVPREPGGARTTTLDSAVGNLFDIEQIHQGATP